MPITKITGVAVSPTGNALHMVQTAVTALATALHLPYEIMNHTPPEQRRQPLVFDAQTLVVIATPTYAGRVPNLLEPYLRTMQGNGAWALPMVTFGNRAYDNALQELADICTACGMCVVSATAMVGEHAFSDKLGAGRPNADDTAWLTAHCTQLATTLHTPTALTAVMGQSADERKFYQPKGVDGAAVNFLKAKPVVTDACVGCGACVSVCPLGSIVLEDGKAQVTGRCMKCNACRKSCSYNAIALQDANYLSHVAHLEQNFARMAENVWFG